MGCDYFQFIYFSFYVNFNPRTHVGCDLSDTTINVNISDFNPRTHVGCDGLFGADETGWGDFNPRTHVGCDFEVVSEVTGIPVFQSTHPCGVRRDLPLGLGRLLYFNPHTHVGCDETGLITSNMLWISIHAPMWGATS